MALVAGAAVAAAAAWLNAKYFIAKDLNNLRILRNTENHVAAAVKQKRISLWYSFENTATAAGRYQEALWSREGIYTFKETWSYACRYGQEYLRLGVGTREPICFFLSNSPDMMFAWLGAWCVGAYPALINYNLSGAGLVHCLRLSKSRIVLVDGDSAIRARIEEIRHVVEEELGMTIIVLDAAMKNKIRIMSTIRPGDEHRASIVDTDTCMILFTSGTTGFPKAVTLSYGRVMRSNKNRQPLVGFELGLKGRFYNCMPIYHGTGAILALMCMTEGCTLCIGKRFSASSFWDDIRDSRSESFVYVGETLRYLLAAPPSPLDRKNNVKTIFGNGLRPDVWIPFRDRFGIEIVAEFFSSTEGVFELLNTSRGDFSATAVGHHGLIARGLWARRGMTCARTSDENTKDLWRDPKTGFCQELPLSVGGEIIVKVPGMGSTESGFAGYMSNEKATAEKFESDVFEKGDMYYRTGDALRRDNDGRWFFLDRLGDTFRWKSENVSTAEVAEALGTFPGILEANVYGVLVPGHDGRAGCAAVYIPGSTEQADKFDWAGLSQHALAKLPRYAVPIFIRVLSGEMRAGMHNMKQNKVELRNDGCDVDKVGAAGDRLYYLPPGKDVYEICQKDQWNGLNQGKLKL